eukprot:Nitzschia sp. Nitz4//scaffold14_size191712//136785//138074//NITZ4_001743-RA/size191712-processed-gene-0.324-mRNA-1//-1//CDS//3329536987//7058//frame0
MLCTSSRKQPRVPILIQLLLICIWISRPTTGFARLPVRYIPPIWDQHNAHYDAIRENAIGHVAMDPMSDQAIQIVQDRLGLSDVQHQKLAQLTDMMMDWNTKVNLISRRNCTREVVFGRHVLPSLALKGISSDISILQPSDPSTGRARVADVGTGGGFPGLPMAIAYPEWDFWLVDSTHKKLAVVQDIAQRLGLTNVRTLHARAPHDFYVEDCPSIVGTNSFGRSILDDTHHNNMQNSPLAISLTELERGTFDLCVGRSVATLPVFSFWVEPLLRPQTGRLAYWTGGQIPKEWLDQTSLQTAISQLLQPPASQDVSGDSHTSPSEKRLVVLDYNVVHSLGLTSGEKVRLPNPISLRRRQRRYKQQQQQQQRGKKQNYRLVRGEWGRRKNAGMPKQRGYDDFQRYDSNPLHSTPGDFDYDDDDEEIDYDV